MRTNYRAIQRQGLGTFIQCGNMYTGEWVNDKRTGKGKLIFANGYEYDGNWKDDMPSKLMLQYMSFAGYN